MARIIIHIDLNSCFATCEQQDNPKWRNKPLGVVQDSGKRSVIIASSIEAKVLGIGTGHKVWEAQQKCPEIILVPARFDKYVDYARKFRKVCKEYSYLVEVFSIDELFIDATKTAHVFGGVKKIAYLIKKRLREEVGDYLKCSVGVAPNKMLAKLASGSEKPDGLVIVPEKNKLDFLDKHLIWHICGIGHRLEKRFNKLGVFTIKQLRQIPVKKLKEKFGIMGQVYADWANGIDHSLVLPSGETPPDKSYGNQLTLANNVDEKEAKSVILWLCWQVASRMRKHKMGGKTVSLYVRRKDKSAYAQKSTSFVCFSAWDIYRLSIHILDKKLNWKGQVRFVGVSISNLIPLSPATLPALSKDLKWLKLSQAWDGLSEKYSPFFVRPASLVDMDLKKTEFNGFTKKF
ncbi:hypothetical protein ACFL1M_01250 [Patescibacteria group bacterium]